MFDLSASAQERINKRRQRGTSNESSGSFALNATSTKHTASCSSNVLPNMDSTIDTPASDLMDLIRGMSSIQMPTLVLGVQSDILFPHWQQREIAQCLREAGNRNITHYELDAIYGHDTFLIDVVTVGAAVKGHLENQIF